MNASENDLRTILAALVNHWGALRVETALKDIKGVRVRRSALSGNSNKRPSKKLSPVEMAERLRARGKKKEAILEIARAFESKQFLPRIGDAKDFLEQHGLEVAGLKDRVSAFRKILLILKKLPPNRLYEIHADELHAGPTRLGPLSDAIGAAGERIRSHVQVG